MTAVIAFVSQKGGVGKSTLARALAAVCAHAGLKVLLADLDPRQQTLVHWQQARAQQKVAPAFSVVAFDEVADALTQAQKHDVVIIDAPAGTNEQTLALAERAHLTVVPTGPSIDDLHPTVLLLHELTNAGIPPSRLVVALCRTLNKNEEESARVYINEAGYTVLAGAIPESAAYRSAQNCGRALTEIEKRELNARADSLIEALLVKIADDAAETDRKESAA